MKKIITIYELLGLIKDGKAPKKIKVTGNVYDFDESYDFYYTKSKKGNYSVALGGYESEINLISNAFNEIVKIIEEDKTSLEDMIDEKILEDEEEFEDIKPLILRTFERTGQAVTSYRLENYCDYNFEMIENTIAKIVLNQKKIIKMIGDNNE